MDFSCELYEGAEWCTPSKGYGDGWNDFWGRFGGFKRKGISATKACCACGGGIRNPKKFSNKLPVYTGIKEYPYGDVSYRLKIMLDDIFSSFYYYSSYETYANELIIPYRLITDLPQMIRQTKSATIAKKERFGMTAGDTLVRRTTMETFAQKREKLEKVGKLINMDR